jgi:NTE family protein
MAKKTALVLSGGGFKGAFQVGALKYLKDNWSKIDPSGNQMKFDLIAGVSVGSLNGVLVASDKFSELEKLWGAVAKNGVEEIYTSDFIDTKSPADTVQLKINFSSIFKRFIPNVSLKNIPLGKIIGLIFSKAKIEKLLSELGEIAKSDLNDTLRSFKSIADNTPLKNKLTTLVKKADIKTSYSCGYVSLNDGKYYSVNSNDFVSDADFVNGVLASTAMPIVWPPVEAINTTNQEPNSNTQKHSVDGGVRNVSPLGDIIKEINKDPANEYKIIIINCSSGEVLPEDYKEKGIASIALRSLNDIALTEVFNNDIEEFIKINDILKQVQAVNPNQLIYNFDYKTNTRSTKPLKRFSTLIIQPDINVLGDSLVANEALIRKRLKHGEDKAKQALDNANPIFV